MYSGSQRLLVIAGLTLSACGSERRAAQSAPDAAAALPACMWTLKTCPEHLDWRFETLLDASELGADARFVAIGAQVVGVSEGASGTQSVVRLHTSDEAERYGAKLRRYAFPASVVRLLDVTDGSSGPGEPVTVYALACQLSDCSLWRVAADEPDGAMLEEIAGSTFDGNPTSLVFDRDRQQPCVLDKGLYCFDGTWQKAIAEGVSDNPLHAVSMGSSMSIAVAAHGVYWTRRAVPPGQPALAWERKSVDAEVTWTGASDVYTGYFLIGEQGAFLQHLPDGNTLCSHTSEFAASSGSILVTKQGEVLFGLNESRCLLQDLGSDVIVDSATVYCRASQNVLLMTERRILGTTFCERL